MSGKILSTVAIAVLAITCSRTTQVTKDPSGTEGSASPAVGTKPTIPGSLRPVARTGETPKVHLAMPMPPEGEERVSLDGCLAATSKDDRLDQEFPPARTRGGPASENEVTAVAAVGGIVVEHRIEHACCLHASVTGALEGRKLDITETLDGAPCRCRCSSVIKYRRGVEAGTYNVQVTLAYQGRSNEVFSGDVVVPATATKPK